MATLINVATPGPALNISNGIMTTAPIGPGYFGGASVVSSGSPTYDNLNSISLSPGTYCVTGIVNCSAGAGVVTSVLSFTTASSIPAAPSHSIHPSLGSTPYQIITAIIKVTVITTVYLNATQSIAATNYQGCILATQIA